VYNCHDSRAYSYKRSRILTGLVRIGLVWLWMGISLGETCQVVKVLLGPKLISVIENNPNKNQIISMSINQGIRYPKRRKGKGGPPILIYSNEGPLKELKRVSSHLL
jgi:hypothetical protein